MASSTKATLNSASCQQRYLKHVPSSSHRLPQLIETYLRFSASSGTNRDRKSDPTDCVCSQKQFGLSRSSKRPNTIAAKTLSKTSWEPAICSGGASELRDFEEFGDI